MKATILVRGSVWAWSIWLNDVEIRHEYDQRHTQRELRSYARRWLETHMPHVAIEEE